MDLLQRKLLSQNFLQSRALVKRLVGNSSLGKNDTVLEIGPGTGIITEILANYAKNVIAVEVDANLFKKLKPKFLQTNVQVINTDFLDYELPRVPYKVFANIPFALTSAIVQKLLSASNPPLDSYLIMQREAAEKFAGIPHETRFSLLMKPWYEFSIIWQFKRFDFTPSPNVSIVLLRIQKRQKPFISEKDKMLYKTFIIYAFSQWKRNVRLGLKHFFTYTQWIRLSKDNQFDRNAKPTDLTFRQWFALYQFYKTNKSH